ncbi:putative ARP2/3 complex 16kDa subunit [Leptomonas seymouri]|uniref:Putative ARP2/3 complex 16kDa subunit n=1 Tax=Leptomonas seymouri TaxID=5684 RepID=A0A0N0P3W8_LEPSE|nr:putative ARP2/3 complex 16kDa subunit [Leptomonas seymouri]|eukprot:KPI84137.1 putative ARP2/3 complex 16kDa subunit [Leptomonas seymouri]
MCKSTPSAHQEVSALCEELDRLAPVSFDQLQRSNAMHIFRMLRRVDEYLVAAEGTADSNENVRKPAATDAPPSATMQRQLALLRFLTMEQQDTLMKVLYACMAPLPAAGQHEKEGRAWLREVYGWYAALYQLTGDGAVIRVLASR